MKKPSICCFLLLPLIGFLLFSGPATAATEAAAAQRRRPGFLFTRSKGICTPEYWSSRRESWPRMVPEMSTVSKVFGSRAYERYRYDLTLLEATAINERDNAFAALVKESTAALINSYARKGYPFSAWRVKTLVIQALVSKHSAAQLAQTFAQANQACNY